MRKPIWYEYGLLYIFVIYLISAVSLMNETDFITGSFQALLIFFIGTYNQNFTLDDGFTIHNILAISGLLTQLFVMVIFLTLLIRYILSKEERIRSIVSYITFNLPIRQILLGMFLAISIIATVVFKFVENVSWIDAIYFVFVSITTVGYGDLVATHPFTKLITIVLIFNGISFIGIASQYLVDRIIMMQLDSKLQLPSTPINRKNHIIIAGFGSKGRKLTKLLIDRNYTVVVIEKDLERLNANNIEGAVLINGDVTKPNTLKMLSVEKASGLFLLLSDDDATIQTGIVARTLSESIDIYAELMGSSTYKIARYAGINRPISLYHYLINVLHGTIFQQEVIPMETVDNMKTYESKLGYLMIPIKDNFDDLFDEVLEIGYVSLNLNEFSVSYKPGFLADVDHFETERMKAMKSKTHKLLAVDKEELINKSKLIFNEIEKINHSRIIFAGYHQFIDEFIDRVNIGNENVIILWQNQREKELLEGKEYVNYEWTIDTGIDLLERLARDGDLFICTFEDITSSMILGVTLNHTKKDTYFIQLVPYEVEIEPFVEIGANNVITPQQIIADALLSSFIKTNHLTPSFIFTDAHIFEHLVGYDDFYVGKQIKDLAKFGVNIIYINKFREGKFREALLADLIEINDRIVIYIRS